MLDEEILRILADWNFWGKKQDLGIKREKYINFIYPFLKTNQAIVITGVRRSGKSTIMIQLANELLTKLKPEDILIINFEDYRLYNLSLNLLSEIYNLYTSKICSRKPRALARRKASDFRVLKDGPMVTHLGLKPKVLDIRKIARTKKRAIFLDEIHKIEEWERFVRTLIDQKEGKIVVTGSNSALITKEYAKLLTGRHVNICVMPLSFKEFLMFKNIDISSELKIISREKDIRKYADEFLKWGGFPELVLAKKEIRNKILTDYFESIITKDVAERHNVKETEKLKALAKFYLTNSSKKISFNRISDYINVPLRTVERFSYFLEEAYLIQFLKRFSFKVKQQEKAPRKVYAIDTGLSNAISFRFSQDIGRIMENVVFLEIMKNNIYANIEVYYWQDQYGKEVDFVIKQGTKVKQLIQVCYDISDFDVKKRELGALLKASKELQCPNLLVITANYKASKKINGKLVRFVPLWKWMLHQL